MLMTAEEAREKSKKSFSPQIIEKLQMVEVRISSACAKGETCCYCNEILPVQVIRELQLNGYTVNDHSDRKGNRMSIFW